MIGLLLGLAGSIIIGFWWFAHPRRRPVIPHGARATWRVVIPREARFGVAEAAAWFTALVPLLPAGGPPTVELRGERGELLFVVSAPAVGERVLRSQLQAWLPGARLERAAVGLPERGVVQPFQLAKPDLYPLRVPPPKEPDPLLGLIALLTQSEGAAGLRITWGPPPADWAHWAPAALAAIREGHRLPPRGAWFWLYQVYRAVQTAGAAPTWRSHSRPAPTAELAPVAAKVQGPAFGVRLVVWAAGPTPAAAARVQALSAALQTVSQAPRGNALVAAEPARVEERGADPEIWFGPELVLSAAELAGLCHLPAPDHPLLPRSPSRPVAPVPRLLPTVRDDRAVTGLGEALTPAGPRPFGLGPEARRLHCYVTGKTGTGKSTLLATIIRQDLEAGRGVAVLDPHGDLAERVLTLVPPERDNEVIYFNPADAAFPISLNLLAATTPDQRPLVASGVIAVFKKLYAEFWGPRLEHTFRQGLLALLETPHPTLLLLPRLLTDRSFRDRVLPWVRDPLLVSFFREEYERYDPRWRAEAIAPILNKVGQFLATPTLRHVVGPSQPGVNLRQVMDAGGIFVANLATGRIGEDASTLLGGLLVAGFGLAAMGRADQPEARRRAFCLTVDEFQYFANDAFVNILSEARKYHLALTLSHQYLTQLPEATREAVLGNMGTLAIFRVGAPDALRLVRELAPAFDLQDLVHLPNYQFCCRLTQAGETLPAFSARTVSLSPPARDPQPLIEGSRRRWARARAAVELEIADLWEGRVD